MKRKRFVKLLMGRLGLTRNEANYVADVTRVTNEREKRRRNGRKLGEAIACSGRCADYQIAKAFHRAEAQWTREQKIGHQRWVNGRKQR